MSATAFDEHRIGPGDYCTTHDAPHELGAVRGRASLANCPDDRSTCRYRKHPGRRCLSSDEMSGTGWSLTTNGWRSLRGALAAAGAPSRRVAAA